ncbi:SMI1/KNR4 family protein [Pseudomonas sp. NPDC089758]|uniref:SMI1/KNR4 family protein n=1 Tax=Pseudomonas sp. NPDC089758 TaxID=3364473 RepID=UPI0038056CD3
MMILSESQDGASEVRVEALCKRLGISSASWIVDFWRKSDGALLNDQVTIYSVSDVEERNRTFEIDRNFRGMIAVGDDSGGRVLLIDKNGSGSIFLVDSGSVSLEGSDKFGTLDKLLDFIVDDAEEGSSISGMGDITTIGSCKPTLDEVVDIKKMLGIDSSVVHLKSILSEPGKVVVRSVNLQKYKDVLIKFSHLIEFK